MCTSVPIIKEFPLSFSQYGMLFFDRLDPDIHPYNEVDVYRLLGQIDTECLQTALNTCVTRHDALRTTFSMDAGDFSQRVSNHGHWPLRCFDLRSEREDQRPQMADQTILDLRQQSYDLRIGPLCRAAIIRLNDIESLLVFGYHHIIVDRRSMDILFMEVSHHYGAARAGKGGPLEPMPLQFGDYARWQQAQAAGEYWDKSIGYWKEQLKDLGNLDLPTNHVRPSSDVYAGDHLSIALTPVLNQQVDSFAEQRRLTPFTVLLAGFYNLLNRHTGQEDISVGTVVHGRSEKKYAETVGFFVNTLVLRMNLQRTQNFETLAAQVKGMTFKAFRHKDVPFEKLVEELNPVRQIGDHPFFRVMFTLVDEREPVPNLGDAISTRVGTHDSSRWNPTSKFDLTLSIIRRQEGYAVKFSYRTALFERSAISRMLHHYINLLDGALSDPEAPLETLQLLTPEEEQLLFYTWNNTGREYPRERCVQALIEETAKRKPSAVAVEGAAGMLRYGELNAKANQLAEYLRNSGVEANSVVAICIERSLDMIIGLLGILKAGGAYLPIDPNYPDDRINYILDHSGAKILLTQDSFRTRWPSPQRQLIALDSDWHTLAQYRDQNPEPIAGPDDLAFVIYTSGSTGQPKGVAVPQRALVNQCLAAIDHFDLGNGQRRLQAASPGFDVATGEIFPTLVAGDTVVLWPGSKLGALPELLDFIETKKLTIIGQPSSYWHQWVAAIERGAAHIPDSLRMVVVGSELVLPKRVNSWLEHAPGHLRWCNAYGPTEATITATIYEPEKGDRFADGEVVPIGKPLANTCIYILDQQRQPVPIGVAGEIYIGGDRLATGYLFDPELTASKFIEWSFNRVGPLRLYATGDLGRYRSDGQIEFLGRRDQQIKLRGFRIELGEISNVLGQHPDVDDVAVIPWEDKQGNLKGILAYVVPGKDRQLDPSVLRRYLKTQLPDYMVPARILVCDVLPLTSHGKLNREQLVLPEDEDRLAHFVAPVNSVEESLAGIWVELFEKDRIGRHDNFFDLGGHSITAMRMVTRIHEALGVKIKLREVFDLTTIAELATAINKLKVDNFES